MSFPATLSRTESAHNVHEKKQRSNECAYTAGWSWDRGEQSKSKDVENSANNKAWTTNEQPERRPRSPVRYANRKIPDKHLEKIANHKGTTILELRACIFQSTTNIIAETIVMLINNGLETLVLGGSEISGKHLQDIAEKMFECNELTDLDLSHITLDKKGAYAVAKIKSKAKKLQSLNLRDCQLDWQLLEILPGEEASKPIKTLNLSSNPKIWDNIKMVADLINKFGCEEIDISSSSLSGSHITELASKVIRQEVKTIRVCENPINDWEALGDLMRNWKVKYLDASACRMHLEDCEDFAFSLDDYQLEKLNVWHADRTENYKQKTRKVLNDSAKELIVDETD